MKKIQVQFYSLENYLNEANIATIKLFYLDIQFLNMLSKKPLL